MNPAYSESILEEINELSQLLKRVESGHSFSTVKYASITDEEAEIIREFDIEVEIDLFLPMSNLDEGSCQDISEEMAYDELEKCLKEAFDFNVRSSAKLNVIKLIESEFSIRIDSVLNLLKNSGVHFIEVEKRIVDKGGEYLVRLDFKQIGRSDIFEFYYFID
ncbi:MAG: hypothetical protein R2788_09860 [Saprospiraceae bacterium]